MDNLTIYDIQDAIDKNKLKEISFVITETDESPECFKLHVIIHRGASFTITRSAKEIIDFISLINRLDKDKVI